MEQSEIEIWKDVSGYENLYRVSNMGRIKSLDRLIICKDGKVKNIKGKILKQSNHSKGYLCLNLYNKSSKKTVLVHIIVGNHFIDNPNNLTELDHINGDKKDNRAVNLRWATRKQNLLAQNWKRKSEKSSIYRGVHFSKLNGKYRASIMVNGKNKHLGLFENEKDAASAYSKALIELTGKDLRK